MRKDTFILTYTLLPEKVGLIHFDTTSRLNVLSKNFIASFNRLLEKLEGMDDVNTLVITGGDKCFSVGADLKELRSLSYEDFKKEDFKKEDFIEKWQALSHFSKPVIAAVSGYVLGGGLELALMADIIVSSKTGIFGFPEVSLGLLPGGGGTQRLIRRISFSKALELCLTGEKISASEALPLNLIDHVQDAYLEFSINLGKKIACFSPLATKAIKSACYEGRNKPLEEALTLERKLFSTLLHQGDFKNKVEAFLNKDK